MMANHLTSFVASFPNELCLVLLLAFLLLTYNNVQKMSSPKQVYCNRLSHDPLGTWPTTAQVCGF